MTRALVLSISPVVSRIFWLRLPYKRYVRSQWVTPGYLYVEFSSDLVLLDFEHKKSLYV